MSETRSACGGPSPAQPWARSTVAHRLEKDDVHVFKVPLDVDGDEVERCWAVLAADERARAERFAFARDRGGYVVTRGTLRVLLAQHLGQDPARIRLSYGPHGKPALADQEARLEFNVSHSGGIALIALARGRSVGVDVERHRPDVLDDRIAERYFSPLECAALRTLPACARVAGFFNCWARKEAYIKACGQGLALPLEDFQVSLAPGEEAALLWARDSEAPRRWSLRDCTPGPGYAGAVAAQGRGWRVRTFEWPGLTARPPRTAALPRRLDDDGESVALTANRGSRS